MRVKIAIAVISLLALLVCAGVVGFVLLRPTLSSSGALTAQPGDTVVDLKWQPIAGARGYFVFRDGSSTPLNPTPIVETRFQDIGLTNGRTYTFTIAPVNQDGKTGSRSPSIQATPKSH